MTKRTKWDLSRPETQAVREKIVHGAYVTEGTMVAFPACFPGMSVPVPADESRITCLDVTADGIVYAGTSGRAAHLLVGMFHGARGMVLDLGAVEGADSTAAVCCGREKYFAAVNGPAGGRIVTGPFQSKPNDLIQEWFIYRAMYEPPKEFAPGEKILHAVIDASRETVVGVTERRLFTVDATSGEISLLDEVPARARLARGSKGGIFGADEGDTLWRFDTNTRALTRRAVKLPPGSWGTRAMMWGSDPATGRLYTADAEGSLFSFTEEEGFSESLGKIPLTPVGPMAATFDGRLFGIAGEGIARMFCYDPKAKAVRDLGVSVSVIERRRYGYAFADALTGRDGEIVFAEDDDLGHLWLYFPKILEG